MLRPLALQVRPTAHLRLYSTQGQGYGRGAPEAGRDEVKAQVANKHTQETARRQKHNLGSSKGGEEGPVEGPPASETIQQGGPFAHADERDTAEKKHGGSTHNRDEYAGRGKPSEGATPSSAEQEGVKNRDLDTIGRERAEEAGRIQRESRDTGGYSQSSGGGTPTSPPTGAGLSAFSGELSKWFSKTTNTFLPTPPLLLLTRSMSTSAAVSEEKEKDNSSLSSEEDNSLHMRGQRSDGSSPQSGVDKSSGPQRHTNEDVSQTRSKTQSGVDPSYKRASGMPSDASEEPTHPVGGGGFDKQIARKQPGKDKGVFQSIKDSITPSSTGEHSPAEGLAGDPETECGKALSRGGQMMKKMKDSVEETVMGKKTSA
ncbi:unnamed protein product [Tilletia controversa]|uniref:Uncharacterized protein n=3 Tax=Tilletia TaxID=13289 RepID=A0A8X7ST72_9BASI|nr:hypothetical protein CF336_g6967 [Tilletia laevis]KAE8186596.1 hypothetical protein CF328_g7184 [Tilletia controversa]KAE8252659.1 hypothetical protein A4X03_0g6106 [Tilletia caries]KAE8191463.1 hypothetical protein CF335_g6080 [Tilletia laevis]KAE8239374.1 hypothetical protein A4X06_0g8293 [Tilletia controversa]